MADQTDSPEALKKQDAALKQMKTVLAKLDKASSTAKTAGSELQKSLDAEKDE